MWKDKEKVGFYAVVLSTKSLRVHGLLFLDKWICIGDNYRELWVIFLIDMYN